MTQNDFKNHPRNSHDKKREKEDNDSIQEFIKEEYFSKPSTPVYIQDGLNNTKYNQKF